ncbi:RNA ligase family protein [Clostridium sp.]|uniref:RNA ligase family protein n=1 Tax=Clostridium sp. TaxID=1506 RepID=UPI00262025F7|nr:RNA ligase family protein [Clostridium sp.]
MRKLASIQIIKNLKPIIGADKIECAEILGWECVVKKGEFNIGDKIVFIEVDSQVPDKPEFEFLKDRKFRVRTIKLRKQISQGLALPITILPKGNYNEGDDVTEIIGVKKYDSEGELEQKLIQDKINKSNNKIAKFLSRYPWYRKLFFKPKKGSFPSFISKTDETRIQNIPNIVNQEKDTEFQVTEKLDGQSGTYFLVKKPKKLFFKQQYEFGVCSRNLHLPTSNNSSYWTIAKQYNIEKVLHKLIGDNQYIVLQGEILGEGIQGNKYKITGYDFYAFNLKYPNKQIDSVTASKTLKNEGIKFVPILETNFKLKDSVSEMVEYAKGKSTLLPILREGVVIRNYNKNLSFKTINPEFLLKNDD